MKTIKQQEQTQDNNFLVWDKLFAKLAWKFKPTKSGDMLIDAEAVYEELKNEFILKEAKEMEKPQQSYSEEDLFKILLDFVAFPHPHMEPRGSIIQRYLNELSQKNENN